MKKEINDLVTISREYGSDKEFVIAGGGNTSWKDEKKIWVKASGTELGKINENGFACLWRKDLEKISSAVYSEDPDEREAQVKNDLHEALADPESKLRPSVETSIHNLIDYSFVVHTHPARINGLLSSMNGRQAASELFGKDVLYVEYTDPGYTLFKKIENELEEYRNTFEQDPKIILLENHGIFVSANTIDEIREIYHDVNSKISSAIDRDLPSGEVPVSGEIPEFLPALRSVSSDVNTSVLRIRNNALINSYIQSPEQYEKINRPFTPDIIVYCKSKYLFVENSEGKTAGQLCDEITRSYEDFIARWAYPPRIVVVQNLGIIGVGSDAASADTILDIFEDLIKISFYSENFGGPKFMSDKEIAFIDNWEVENYRRKISLGAKKGGKIQNKTAIVTGGAQGFGRGIVENLYDQGANVVIADINVEKGQEFAAELNQKNGKNQAEFIPVDVSELSSFEELVHTTVKQFGGLDLFVSNAGILFAGSIEEMDVATFDKMTRVNYNAYFYGVKAVVPIFKLQNKYRKSGYFDIVQINSKSGLKGSNKNFTYAGGKFGGIGLTQSFALELMPFRIKVNSICPGNFFDGPLWADPEKGLFVQYLNTGKVPGAKTIEDVKRFYEAQVPANRGCRVEDVMKALYYAIDQEYETGQAIPVTGGQNMLK